MKARGSVLGSDPTLRKPYLNRSDGGKRQHKRITVL